MHKTKQDFRTTRGIKISQIKHHIFSSNPNRLNQLNEFNWVCKQPGSDTTVRFVPGLGSGRKIQFKIF